MVLDKKKHNEASHLRYIDNRTQRHVNAIYLVQFLQAQQQASPSNYHAPGIWELISCNSSVAIFALDNCDTFISTVDAITQTLIAYAEVIMGRRAALQYAEPQVSRVLRKEHTHTLKKRCVEQYCVYRLLAHN